MGRLNRLALLLTILFVAAGTSCSLRGQTEVYYVRMTRAHPEEASGLLRVAQDSVRVNVKGSKAVSEIECAGYYLLHPDDTAAFLRAADRLNRSDKAGKLMTADEYEAIRKAEGAGK